METLKYLLVSIIALGVASLGLYLFYEIDYIIWEIRMGKKVSKKYETNN